MILKNTWPISLYCFLLFQQQNFALLEYCGVYAFFLVFWGNPENFWEGRRECFVVFVGVYKKISSIIQTVITIWMLQVSLIMPGIETIVLKCLLFIAKIYEFFKPWLFHFWGKFSICYKCQVPLHCWKGWFISSCFDILFIDGP